MLLAQRGRDAEVRDIDLPAKKRSSSRTEVREEDLPASSLHCHRRKRKRTAESIALTQSNIENPQSKGRVPVRSLRARYCPPSRHGGPQTAGQETRLSTDPPGLARRGHRIADISAISKRSVDVDIKNATTVGILREEVLPVPV